MAKVEIRSKDGLTEIFVDGNKLSGVTEFCFKQKRNSSSPRLYIEIFADDVTVNGDVIIKGLKVR